MPTSPRARAWQARAPESVRDVGLDKLCQQGERFLPAEIASLRRDDGRQPLLRDVQFGAAGNPLQGDRRLHLAGQVRVVEFVRVPDAFVRYEFEVFPAKGV